MHPHDQVNEKADESHGLYCHDSNTVFYYSEYKVLLLLDFSKSTSSIYPYQSKCYVDKLLDSIEIFIHVTPLPTYPYNVESVVQA